MRKFTDLTQAEILALAIANEEEDGRIYADFAHQLRDNFPDSAGIFSEMANEEQDHRRRLIDLYAERFGNHIPLVRRQDVAGFAQRRAPWQVQHSGIDTIRRHARQMELDAARFYRQAATRTSDPAIRKLLGDLAEAEDAHEQAAGAIELKLLPASKRETEDDHARRRFVLQVVQPGLVGLMDGSVSTLAPVFAAAFATHLPWNAFLVGMAASVGAGISMGFAEAASDDGVLSGRGAPLLRGLICGLMTTLGGIGHTLPFLINDFRVALVVAAIVVVIELAIISWIRWRYQDTPFLSAAIQIMFGGGLVFAAGVLIGSS
ncbi:iron exporter MbfA [Lichenicola sp.]|uniref:iron exporter MbfA n=1 Tax=Lichenicola sp. TaxID=2804529 RepID=UPI003B007C14